MTNEIASIPVPESQDKLTQHISPKILKFLEDRTTDYYHAHSDNYDDILDPYESLGICANIIHTAFQIGADDPSKLPQKVTDAEKAIRKGLQYRNNFLEQARTLLFSDGTEELKDHAISSDRIHEARNELRESKKRADFPVINSLFSTIEKRKAILPDISNSMLKFFIPGLPSDQQNEIVSHMQDATVQSMLIRGVIFSMIGRIHNVEINPLFVSDQNLKSLHENNKTGDFTPLIEPIVAELTRRISDSVPPEEVTELLTDYGKQVAQMYKTWINIQKNDQSANEDYKYWQKRNEVLKRLPIISLVPDVDYIDTPENLSIAIRKNVRHVWQNPEHINEYVLPSLHDLSMAEKMYYEAGMAEDDPKFIRIKQAIQLRRSFQSKLNSTSTTIKALERTLENLQNFFEQTDNSIFSVTRNPDTIDKEIHEIELLQRRSERSKKQDDENRMLLEEIEQIQQNSSPEAKTRLKALIYNKLHSRQVRTYNRQSEIIKEKLYMPGWKSFFSTSMEGNYQNPERIYRELSLIQRYLKEMKDDPDKILPDDYTADTELLQKFIISEMSTLYTELDQRPNTNLQHKKYIDMAKKMGLQGNLQWTGFRNLFLNSMRKSQYQLQDLIVLNNKKRHVADDLNNVTNYLETGVEQEETQLILASIDEKKIADTIKELKLQILPKEDLKIIDKDLLNQAQEIARLYRETRGQIQFRFPERVKIDSFLREKNLTIQRGKGMYVREFLSQLQYMTHSPFFPIQYAENTSLKLVMSAFNARLKYAEYMLLSDEREKEIQEKKEELAKAKQKQEWADKKNQEANVSTRIKNLKLINRTRQQELIESLAQLKFVIPEKEFEELQKK